jgi:small subunit ribosomal protein S16
MVVIRLSRGGAKKRPFYHIVVSDKRSARDGRCIERIGYFNPIASGNDVRLQLNYERMAYWIGTGAQPSDRVRSLMKSYEKSAKTAGDAGSTKQ